MFYVNLSALNPNYGTGLSATYNPQTYALDISIDENVIPNIQPNVPLSPVQTLSTLQVNGIVYGIPDTRNFVTIDTNQEITGFKDFNSGKLSVIRSAPIPMKLAFMPDKFVYSTEQQCKNFLLPTGKPSGTLNEPTEYTFATTDDIPSTATSTSTSTVTPETGTFVTGTSTNTTNVVNSVTYTPSSETLTFTYADNTTASFTFLTSSTTVTSGTTSVVTSVTDSTSNAMTGATVSTSTTTTLS